MSKIVRYAVDLNHPPPLTDEQKAELKALSERPDSEIDYSDIPPLDDQFWARAVPARDVFLQRKVDAGRVSMAAGRGRADEEVEAEFAAKRAAIETTSDDAPRVTD
jgi:hypothetical protein